MLEVLADRTSGRRLGDGRTGPPRYELAVAALRMEMIGYVGVDPVVNAITDRLRWRAFPGLAGPRLGRLALKRSCDHK